MAQLLTVRLNKADHQPLGFRLQGGKDFGTPLVVQKVNGGSAAERAGLQAGDALIRVNATDVYTLRHQDAQDTIRAAGPTLELTVQRGGGTWRPSVTPTGSLPRPGSRPLGGTPVPVTNTSLKATSQTSRAFGSGHNQTAKPFGYMNGNEAVKSIVNKQYNTPVNMYSDQTIAETLSAQTEVLAGGVLGVNFKKNEKTYDAEKSAVFKVLQEEQNDPEPVVEVGSAPPVSGLRHVQAPVTRPDAPINNTGGLPPGQNICEECERLITGVFVRIKDKNLHVECFKCSTCGTSLKNQGYYNLNGKLYCDIHAKLVARQNPPASNLEPVTVPPGGRVPTNTYSTPLPPIATNYTNGSSSLFSPTSNISGPKPFGSSIGSAYSPSLSPRSAPLSPATRPVPAPTHAAPPFAPTHAAPPFAPTHAAQPFAPTASVKSVVWPPPNNPEDEPPKVLRERDPSPTTVGKIRMEPAPLMIAPWAQKPESESLSQSNANRICENTQEQIISSSQQTSEFCSTVSYASTTAVASTKSETIIESNKSQLKEEITTCVQSISEQVSSEKQSFTIYESQTSPPVQKSFDFSLENVETNNQTDNSTKEIAQQQCYENNKQSSSVLYSNNTVKSTDVKEFVTDLETSKEYQENETSKAEFKNTSTSSDEATSCKNPENVQGGEVIQEYSEINCQIEVVDKVNTENISIEARNTIEQTPTTSLGSNLLPQTTLVDALTTAPDRPYSPLPAPTAPISVPTYTSLPDANPPQEIQSKEMPKLSDQENVQEIPAPQAPLFSQQIKRGITPIPPIKTFNPPEKREAPIPMPPETQPYIPPDFKIKIEPKVSRDETSSPMIEALTTAPDRPFTPITTQSRDIERSSLRDALTIAPDRSYSPLPLNIVNQSSHFTSTSSMQVQSSISEIVRPTVTQTSTQMTEQIHSEFSTMQNTCKLQSSSEVSAFKPVAKQVFPPPQPDEFAKLSNFTPNFSEIKSTFGNSKVQQETIFSESKSLQQSSTAMSTQGYSSVKTAQNFFEQLDQKESLSSNAVRAKSGLHKPDSIPPYQKHFEQLPSQRGITPEICNAPAVFQRPVTPTTDPPTKPRDKSQEPKPVPPPVLTPQKVQQTKPQIKQLPVQFHKDNTPISMTFQPVSDETFFRASPARSRPSTPSLINKPAPIIPHYQMNLVTVEHLAPDSHLYDPSSPETSRSPTPKPRSRSPAQGPPPNPLKAQAPRIKQITPQHQTGQSLLTQATSNLRKEHDSAHEIFNTSGARSWAQNQPSVIKEQRQSNIGFKSESYNKGNMNIKEDSMINQNFGQRQMQSQNISEYGNTTVQTTRKSFEEFERTQSAKVIEIRKGGSSSSSAYNQMSEMSALPSSGKPNQVFPPPVMSLPTYQQSSSINLTNANKCATNSKMCQPNPSISGANQDPVCDPTPSTGSSVGAAARGKAFGVSSAPKRGRGILNKAALPGSRVPLCVNDGQSQSVLHKTEFKSPAEERLIRKMAKMALNGYEIGIQRKIKPADHIQSMADKIQDTVVTKHPLNTDSQSCGENGKENALKTPNKYLDGEHKTIDSIHIGDPIPVTILKDNFTTVDGNVPIPPPIPNSPIPTFNVHSSPTIEALNASNVKKPSEFVPKSLSSNYTLGKKINNENGSYENVNADKRDYILNNTLKSKPLHDKSASNGPNSAPKQETNKTDLKFDSNHYSNTLNKINMFEKKDATNNFNEKNSCSNKTDKTISIGNDMNTLKKNEKSWSKEKVKNNGNIQSEEKIKNDGYPVDLYDNTLYTFKSKEYSDDSNNTVDSEDCAKQDLINKDDMQNDTESEVIVKRRPKKTNRNSDGRRDSHIIARPLSTMTSVDKADGLYPVCHKCDKAITRGPFITALGRIWCPEHFICVNATCRRPLQDIGFVEENGQLYCEYCFEQYIAPACDKCHAKIKGRMDYRTAKQTGMSCLRRNVSHAGSPWRRATGGSRRSTITTTVSASTARCARKTSKDRASSQREADHSARCTHANSPYLMYNSDTVYSTTTFRPVSPSPRTTPAPNASPQRTRKLETPLHFDGGLFSDIKSADGKLLSKVTVDRVQSTTRHDVTDSPSVFESVQPCGNKDYVDDIVRSETVTNEEVFSVKFTPIPPEIDVPRLLTPSQFRTNRTSTPREYVRNNFEDLQSYKIVNSLCKDSLFDSTNSYVREEKGSDDLTNIVKQDESFDNLKAEGPYNRTPSPLANFLVSEQLTKIDNYLQESLKACSAKEIKSAHELREGEKLSEIKQTHIDKTHERNLCIETSTSTLKSYHNEQSLNIPSECIRSNDNKNNKINKSNSVREKNPGVLCALYNMPFHYHAAILCFFLIVYNLIYQYIKENCHGNKK